MLICYATCADEGSVQLSSYSDETMLTVYNTHVFYGNQTSNNQHAYGIGRL